MMLIYIAKNNNIERIETVSDEAKSKEYDFCNILCRCMELENNVPKRSVRGQQNPNLIVGREVKFENDEIITYNALIEWKGRDNANESGKQQSDSSRPSLRKFSGNSHRADSYVISYFELL